MFGSSRMAPPHRPPTGPWGGSVRGCLDLVALGVERLDEPVRLVHQGVVLGKKLLRLGAFSGQCGGRRPEGCEGRAARSMDFHLRVQSVAHQCGNAALMHLSSCDMSDVLLPTV